MLNLGERQLGDHTPVPKREEGLHQGKRGGGEISQKKKHPPGNLVGTYHKSTIVTTAFQLSEGESELLYGVPRTMEEMITINRKQLPVSKGRYGDTIC